MLTSRLRARRTGAVIAIALMSGTVLGACSADEGSANDDAEPAPAISIDADLSMESDEDSEEEEAEELSEECLELQEVWADTNRALVGISEEHPRMLVAGFREAYRSITSVDDTDDVPGWDGMTQYLSRAVGAFEDVQTDDAAEVASAITLTFSDVDTSRAATAHSQVTAYLDAGCRG